MNITQNGAIWICFGSVFVIFLPNLAFSNLHNLYICNIEIINLLYKDHTVSVWHYHNSENPYHPSTATGLPETQPQCPKVPGPVPGPRIPKALKVLGLGPSPKAQMAQVLCLGPGSSGPDPRGLRPKAPQNLARNPFQGPYGAIPDPMRTHGAHSPREAPRVYLSLYQACRC